MLKFAQKNLDIGSSNTRVYRIARAIFVVMVIILLFLAFEIIPPTIEDYISSRKLLETSRAQFENLQRRDPNVGGSIQDRFQSSDYSERVIKVATLDDAFWKGYLGSSTVSGYGPAYLEEIAKYTGWTYEYYPTTIADATARLKTGEIDVVAPRVNTSSPDLLYTSRSVGTMATCYVVKSNSSIAFRDFKSFDGKRFGAIKGTDSLQKLEQDSLINNYRYDLTIYDSNSALLTALTNDEVDVAVAADVCISNTEPFRKVYSFPPNPFYFAVAAGNVGLAREFNSALEQINALDPSFNTMLSEKYVFGRNDEALTFSPEELTFIENAKEIRVGFYEGQAPLQYSASKDHPTASGADGVLGRILDTLSAKTQLSFKGVAFNTTLELEEAIRNNDVDMVSNFPPRGSNPSLGGLVPTPHYASSPVLLVSKVKDEGKDIARVGLPQGIAWLATEIKRDFPEVEILITESARDGFRLLASDDIDACYANMMEVEYILSDIRGASSYHLEYSAYVDQLCFGISNLEDPALLSIVSNAIHSLSSVELTRLTSGNLYPKPEGAIGFLRENAVEFGLVTGLAMLLIFIVMWYERKKVLKQIRENAFTDQLTGLANRHRFITHISSLINENKAAHTAVLTLDINNFKSVNHLYSESLGNELLIHIGQLLKAALPKGSLIAHDNADIFLICIPDTSKNDVEQLIINKIMPIEHLNFKNAGELELSFIVGIYMMQESDMTAGNVVNKADVARLEGKKNLGNPINFFTDDMHHNLISKSILENDLKLALVRNEFVVHYQAKFDLKSMETVSHEALIRWNHSLAGFVYPSDFIPLAESLGIITKVSAVVVTQVCRDYANLSGELLKENVKCIGAGQDPLANQLRFSINLSAHDILEKATVDLLKEMVEKHEIDPQFIQIEVTEGVVLADKTRAIRSLSELKELGYSVALDDFGTGYSSLGLLNELPIDTVKIDKRFVRDIEVDPKSRQVLSSIVNLINDLGLISVAEGIETEYQLDFLREIGCQYGQGFYYSVPLPADQLIPQLMAHKQGCKTEKTES